MSCSSSTHSSTDTSHPAFPDLGWFWKFPLAWLAGTVLWLERRRQYGELLELDDRLLADIGVSRATVEEVRRSSLYLDAWRDSR
ncbi:DUF1127 domain-containing protein [Bradyrhizobium diazoefficiens]|uniref:DUF1127 domain-containing protein n=1 Tax=Bradyrhizobium diazoefficiens TaxID=1355477 RepID=UPI00190D857B|nr:DUF1127 domain-containing protein [Bradyrhizobium diazoefficiens]MBK3663093.1 DUF1127 domain-containing protein [Bradyrhizobium diazoefficiens]